MISRLWDEREKMGRLNDDPQQANLWELVNCVTGFEQHDRTRHGNLNAVQRALIAVDDSACDKAWNLAIGLAN